MRNIATILKYEISMQIKSVRLWVVFAFALAVALLDNFPSEANLDRLDFLTDQGYVVSRILAHAGVLMLFGFMFLLSDRIRGDRKKGISELFMASPLSKKQYIWGKVLGNYVTVLFTMAIYFAINALVQLVHNPGPFSPVPYAVGFFAMAVPACFFVSACAVALPAVIDIRMFYVLFSIYFLMNTDFIYTENGMIRSLYLFQKDILKLVYTYIQFEQIIPAGLLWNLAFLICSGIGAILLLKCRKSIWRETA